MQKMSFRQVRDIQEAVRLLSEGLVINGKYFLIDTCKYGHLQLQIASPFGFGRLCLWELFGMTNSIPRFIIILSELLHDDNISKKHMQRMSFS